MDLLSNVISFTGIVFFLAAFVNPVEMTAILLEEDDLKDISHVEFIEPSYFQVEIHAEVQGRTALKHRGALWPEGKVPYVMSTSYDEKGKKILLNAMDMFHNQTCIRFEPRKSEAIYISIAPGKGCFAHVGRTRAVGTLSFGNKCYTTGTAIHELMHSLGFVHEQSRPDRDEFVRINYGNIDVRNVGNFRKYTWNRVQVMGVDYDYDSVMHYGMFDFAKERRTPTIVPKKEGVRIGQRRDFSEGDLLKINRLYNCTEFL